MREYLEAIPMAHNMGRSSIVLSRVQPWQRDYWLREARRHFDRARWYIKQVRSLRKCQQNTLVTPTYTPTQTHAPLSAATPLRLNHPNLLREPLLQRSQRAHSLLHKRRHKTGHSRCSQKPLATGPRLPHQRGIWKGGRHGRKSRNPRGIRLYGRGTRPPHRHA